MLNDNQKHALIEFSGKFISDGMAKADADIFSSKATCLQWPELSNDECLKFLRSIR